jgi:hypothetical protein
MDSLFFALPRLLVCRPGKRKEKGSWGEQEFLVIFLWDRARP